MLKSYFFVFLLLGSTALLAQTKPNPAATGYQGKDEKRQNKIPIKCKPDSNCVDETASAVNPNKKGPGAKQAGTQH